MASLVLAFLDVRVRKSDGAFGQQQRRSPIFLAFALIASLVLVVIPLAAPVGAASGDFVAYNDMSTAAGVPNPANVTSYTYRTSGPLKDYSTGLVLPVTVTGSTVGGPDLGYANGGPVTNSGSDAYAVFNDRVDLTGMDQLDGTDWAAKVTFSGLDPSKLYAVTLSANRAEPTYVDERYARVTISGVDASTAASTAGVEINSPTSVSFSIGDNSVKGYVAKWVAIDPGPDGEFTVTSEWDATLGTQPPGEYQGHENRKGYAMAAFKLETYTPPPPDVSPPVISLLGDAVVTVGFAGSYVDAGAIAWDDPDGDITAKIVTVGDVVDTTVVGDHVITYDVKDAAGNAAVQVKRTVRVAPAPVLDVVVVGGSVVVSDAVVAQLGGLVSGSVSRVAGANRYATAAAVSKARFGSGVPSVFVATGEDFPDALAAGAPAGREGSPILLTRQGSLPSETAAELARLKPGRIVVVGGSVVVSDAVVAQLRAFTSGPVVRVAGANRYATAAAVSALMFKPGAAVAYVATGENFPDALAGGPAGVIKGGPILLTRQGSLPSETAAELARLKPAKIVVLGGTVAVSSTVAGQLAAYTTGGVSRFAGANRYATAVAVSQGVFASGANVVFVVTGTNFPDAMAAGPAAGIYGGPILLDAGGLSLPAVTAAEIRRLDQ